MTEHQVDICTRISLQSCGGRNVIPPPLYQDHLAREMDFSVELRIQGAIPPPQIRFHGVVLN